MNSIQKIKTVSTRLDKIIYATYATTGLLFLAMAVFLMLRISTYAALLPSFPLVALCILTGYILLQLITAYGLFFCQRWVLLLFTTHVGITLITLFILLPLFDMNNLVLTSLLSSAHYWILLGFTFTTQKYCTGRTFHPIYTSAYALILLGLVFSRLYLL